MFRMPDGTATFETMYHEMELECKKKQREVDGGSGSGSGSAGNEWERRCQHEYGSALYMTPEEKQISFYNRYFIFRKNRNINAKQLKSSFLSYAGLQEEQHRVSSSEPGDVTVESIALEKIAKASRPIDVASKPAIAAHILEERKDRQISESTSAAASSTTLKSKPKLKKVTTIKAGESAKSAESASAAPPPVSVAVSQEVSAPSAPIEQIEKKIQKRTKKVKATAAEAGSESETGKAASAEPPAKPKRQTKKKSDL